MPASELIEVEVMGIATKCVAGFIAVRALEAAVIAAERLGIE